jgi:hypothetical protein
MEMHGITGQQDRVRWKKDIAKNSARVCFKGLMEHESDWRCDLARVCLGV